MISIQWSSGKCTNIHVRYYSQYSTFSNINEIRLVRSKHFIESCQILPGLGMKVALISFHALGMYSQVKLALMITHSFLNIISGPFAALLDKFRLVSATYMIYDLTDQLFLRWLSLSLLSADSPWTPIYEILFLNFSRTLMLDMCWLIQKCAPGRAPLYSCLMRPWIVTWVLGFILHLKSTFMCIFLLTYVVVYITSFTSLRLVFKKVALLPRFNMSKLFGIINYIRCSPNPGQMESVYFATHQLF